MEKEFTQKHRERINSVLGDVGEYLGYLYDRWQDEKEYEDFNDYKVAMEKKLPSDFKFVTMTQKPFKVRFNYDGFLVSYIANSRTVKSIITIPN